MIRRKYRQNDVDRSNMPPLRAQLDGTELQVTLASNLGVQLQPGGGDVYRRVKGGAGTYEPGATTKASRPRPQRDELAGRLDHQRAWKDGVLREVLSVHPMLRPKCHFRGDVKPVQRGYPRDLTHLGYRQEGGVEVDEAGGDRGD